MTTGTLTLHDGEDNLDAFLQFNEREVLTHAGKLRADVAEKLALEHYESFDAVRREAARLWRRMPRKWRRWSRLSGLWKARDGGRRNDYPHG